MAERRTKACSSLIFERLCQAGGGFGNVGRALSHRNYRVYISGNSIQLTGTWLQRVSCGWLAWTLTHSGAWLGLISMAEFLPVLFLAPLAGVMRGPTRRVLMLPVHAPL